MINYRVDDLDALLEELAAARVWIDPKRQNESYGRFAWIKDCDGNRVELWQPLDEGSVTTREQFVEPSGGVEPLKPAMNGRRDGLSDGNG